MERRAQQKADEERLKEEAEKNKARDKEIQAIHRKLKGMCWIFPAVIGMVLTMN